MDSSPHRSPRGRKKNPDYIQVPKSNQQREDGEVAPDLDKRWAQLVIDGKQYGGRSYHSMTLYNESVIVYGGFDDKSGLFDDFYFMKITDAPKYEWKSVSISQSQNKVKPGKRRRHSALIYEDKFYMFGGQKNMIYNCNDLHYYDFKARVWKQIKAENAPPPCDSHGAVIHNDKMIIVCGFIGDKDPQYTNHVYAFDLKQEKWECLFEHNPKEVNAPKPRANSGICLNEDDIYVHGGCTYEKKYKDLWKFNLQNNKWVKIEVKGDTIPDVRNGHTMINYKEKLYIFGGIQDITKEKNDIYAYNVQENKWEIIHYEAPIEFKSPTTKKKNNNKSPQRYQRLQSKLGSADPLHPLNSPLKKKGMGILGEEVARQIKQQMQKQEHKDEMDLQIDYYSTNNGEKTFVEQKKSEQQAQMKMLMLKDLVISPEENMPDSPISENMKKSINMIGDPRSKREREKELQQQQQQLMQQQGQISMNFSKQEDPSSTMKPKKHLKQFVQGNNILIGKKPCGRDGASVCLLNDGKILIYGGDRHLMSFNNLFFFNLEGNISEEQGQQQQQQTQQDGQN